MLIELEKIWQHLYITIKTFIFKYQHLNKEEHDFICKINDFKLKVNSHSVLAKPLFIKYGFEAGERKMLKSFIKPGMTVFDIGANIGLYTIMFAKQVGKYGKVYSFEPYPPIAEYLLDNIKLNDLKNVTVCKKAVSDRNGEMDFYVFPKGQDVYNSLGAKERLLEKLNTTVTINVIVDTIDNYCRENKIINIDLVKIDVEGAEENVIKGATNILKSNKNIMVLTEIYEPSAKQCGCSGIRLTDYLRALGFLSFQIKDNGQIEKINDINFMYPATQYILFKKSL